jgi:hypothetical protein
MVSFNNACVIDGKTFVDQSLTKLEEQNKFSLPCFDQALKDYNIGYLMHIHQLLADTIYFYFCHSVHDGSANKMLYILYMHTCKIVVLRSSTGMQSLK